MAVSTRYLPIAPIRHLNNPSTWEQIKEEDKLVEQAVGEALDFLASLNTKEREPYCLHMSEWITQRTQGRALINLCLYIGYNSSSIAWSFVSCFIPRSLAEGFFPHETVPIPEAMYRGMEESREQFHRNLGGLVVVAPVAILVNALVSGGESYTVGMEIATNFVLEITAGFNTYALSGNTGVTLDGNGGCIMTVAQRAAIIQNIERIYHKMAKTLEQRWKGADEAQKKELKKLCEKINANWSYIYRCLIRVGIDASKVDNILRPLDRARAFIEAQPNPVQEEIVIATQPTGYTNV